MRIWDVNPGYLNRFSLLGEHRELHAIVSIIRNNKKGYSNHPETRRWLENGWALRQRHKLIAAEMHLRGYVDKSPVLLGENPGKWPKVFINSPAEQLSIISNKYLNREQGRIPLPKNAQHMWAQHKYSVMARDISFYKSMGRWVSDKTDSRSLEKISSDLVELLKYPPEEKLIQNALLHMWGYVSEFSLSNKKNIGSWAPDVLLNKIQKLAVKNNVPYLLESTALSELGAWDL